MNKIGLIVSMLFFPTMIFAATMTATTTAVPIDTPTPTPVQYDLPYPGMLPDNPLYTLKKIRDFILDKLISDPIKKTEFYILQADKRLSMGMQLLASGNKMLAEQTISKGEKYMNSAVSMILSLKAQGKDVPAYITDRITKSLAKHKEVITLEIDKATDVSIKSGLTGSLNLVNTLQGEILKMK